MNNEFKVKVIKNITKNCINAGFSKKEIDTIISPDSSITQMLENYVALRKSKELQRITRDYVIGVTKLVINQEVNA